MAFAELAAGLWMLVAVPSLETNDTLSHLTLKTPLVVFGAVITADALARLGWLHV